MVFEYLDVCCGVFGKLFSVCELFVFDSSCGVDEVVVGMVCFVCLVG